MDACEGDSSFTTIDERANKCPVKGSKRKKMQLERHSPKPPVRAGCNHARKPVYKCAEVTDRDMDKFNAAFYKHNTKISQDNMIAKFISVCQKKREKKRGTGDPQRSRSSGETMFFISDSSNKKVRVCKDFFLKLLNVGRSRIENIAKHCVVNDGLITEKRGGDHKKVLFASRREAVCNFIKSLKGRESHYSRKKSKKLYLPSNISSIKQLWKIYLTDHNDLPVGYQFFRRIFHKFCIGFGSPKTDACSFCERLRNQLKGESDQLKKQSLMTDLRIHKLRSNSFYELLREKKAGLKTFCFDHQQNQVLPKVPDQIAYYSRQFYIYNFTVVENNNDGSLTPDNVFVYSWMENLFAKNSSSCASAVFDMLKKSNMDNVSCVRLVSDGCGGQNKNSAFLYMAGHWLKNHAPPHVKSIEFLFPVRGHSFLPCDRVFGVIEKKLRKMERIYTPEEYHNVFRQQGTLRLAGDDFDVLDFKEVSDRVLRKPLPIKIQENKRFFITKGSHLKVRAEPNYRNSLNAGHYVTKKGQSFARNPVFVAPGIRVNDAKISDVKKLMLEHVGERWEADPRFTFLYSLTSEPTSVADADDENENCNCLGEDDVASCT